MAALIRFENLFTYTAEATGIRLPLSALASGTHHVHGRLEIIISGKPLPALGYAGTDDVCLNTWTSEISAVVEALNQAGDARYIFDEGEQGQPAYLFVREHDVLYVSVVDSVLSGAQGDPSYQQVSCVWEDFRQAATQYVQALRAELEREVPSYASAWLQRFASAA
jgi:hypothetical protein